MAVELRESAAFANSTHKVEGGKFIVAGQFSRADKRNENGRVYRRSMWENVLHRPNIVDALSKRKMLGELGHPDKIETTPLNVSHIVTALELKPDGEIWGEAEILDTPSGRVLKTLYEAGVEMGISSRGFLPEGSNLYAEGEDLIVPDDYELITFDFVIDPSSQGACPKVQESVKKELTSILTESRDKINSDMVAFIENINVLNEDVEISDKTALTEDVNLQNNSKLDESINNESKEDSNPMEDAYVNRLEAVVGELRNRYLTAESVIKEFMDEREKADAMLKGVTNRYLTAEQAVEGLRDYSVKLEEAVGEVVSLYKTSTDVIANLKNRCNLSESVINDLVARYTLSEQVVTELSDSYKLAEQIISELRDRYTLSESVIREFVKRQTMAEAVVAELVARNALAEQVIVGLKDRLEAARKSNISLKKKLGEVTAEMNINNDNSEINEEIEKLQQKVELQESVITDLTTQLKESKALIEEKAQEVTPEPVKEEAPKKVPVPNSYFESIAQKYGVSVTECKNVFKSLGCRKSAFEFHMNEMKRVARNNYSEFPFMVNNATASQALNNDKTTEEDRIARLVESAF